MLGRILILVAALAVFTLAPLAVTAQSIRHENTQGCYVFPAGDKHYVIVNHVLYANSAGQWYALRPSSFRNSDYAPVMEQN
jgi:hypothetical protein